MKLALPLALVLAISTGAAHALPAMPAPATAASLQAVDYYVYRAPRVVVRPPVVVAPRVAAPRVVVRGPCRTKVVKYTPRGKVVRSVNRCL